MEQYLNTHYKDFANLYKLSHSPHRHGGCTSVHYTVYNLSTPIKSFRSKFCTLQIAYLSHFQFGDALFCPGKNKGEMG